MLAGGTQVIAAVAGWWPRWGIGFWVYTDAMTRNNDGIPLEVLASPGATPLEIGQTVPDRADAPIATTPTGALAIVPSSFRDVALRGTKVEMCTARARTCGAVPGASTWDRPASRSSLRPDRDGAVGDPGCSRDHHRRRRHLAPPPPLPSDVAAIARPRSACPGC